MVWHPNLCPTYHSSAIPMAGNPSPSPPFRFLTLSELMKLQWNIKSENLGSVPVPLFSPQSFPCGTIREVHLKTCSLSRPRQIIIRLVSHAAGHFTGHITDQAESERQSYFRANSPKEAEHHLRQVIDLYANESYTLVLAIGLNH